jgi:hypothetical protein
VPHDWDGLRISSSKQIHPRYRAFSRGEGGEMARSATFAIIDSEAGCQAAQLPLLREVVAGTACGKPQPQRII